MWNCGGWGWGCGVQNIFFSRKINSSHKMRCYILLRIPIWRAYIANAIITFQEREKGRWKTNTVNLTGWKIGKVTRMVSLWFTSMLNMWQAPMYAALYRLSWDCGDECNDYDNIVYVYEKLYSKIQPTFFIERKTQIHFCTFQMFKQHTRTHEQAYEL